MSNTPSSDARSKRPGQGQPPSPSGAPAKKARARGKAAAGRERPVSGGDLVVARLDFYRDQSSKVWKVLWVSVACLVVSIALTVVSLTQQQRNVYFATDQGGSLIRLVPLSEPNHKDAVISQWLSRALTDTFNFNFSNIRFRLNEAAQKWFTSNGATELIQELRDNGTWQTIEERELIVSLSVDHVPLVIDKGPIANGRYYAWKLQAPATLTFRNTKGQPFTNKVVFTVVVQRRSMLEDPTGLGIAKIIMRNQER